MVSGARRLDARTVLVCAVLLGAALRLARVASAPLIHPDSPAYLDLAAAALDGHWLRLFGGYYSPLYPLAVAPFLWLGAAPELAGRLAAALAGTATIPLVYLLARRCVGDAAAGFAALAAALQPALVKGGAQVLPETLAGLCLAGSVLATVVARAASAGALAGAMYLTRPEGLFAVPLAVARVGWTRPRRVGLVVVAALAVAAPALIGLRMRTGHWALSGREQAIAERAGVEGETSLVAATLHQPGKVAARWVAGAGKQSLNVLIALGPVLAVPWLVGLWGARRRGDDLWPLFVVAAFAWGPVALNPSPRYAVPGLALLLPWVGAGVATLRERIGARAPLAIGAAAVALSVLALWPARAFDEDCNREVADLIRTRYGTGQMLVAVDGRFAFAAGGIGVVPKTTAPKPALELARRRGARLWLSRPHWIGKAFVLPDDVRPVARPCSGAFTLFEIGAPPSG